VASRIGQRKSFFAHLVGTKLKLVLERRIK
jgi:hypothetical protein